MKKKLLTLALVAGLVLSSFSASFAALSVGNDRSSSTDSTKVTGSSSGTNSGTTSVSTNANGQTVNTSEYTANGITMKEATVSDGTVVREASSYSGAANVVIRTTEGGAATAPDGEPICKMAVLVITENGVSQGCFVNPETGKPYATGADFHVWAYDAYGNLVLHYVNAQGYFYTGQQIINGQTVIFNNEGVLVS